MTFYWSTALAFLLMDFTQRPAFLMKYKIQPGKNTPPNTAKVIKVSKNAKMREITRLKMTCLLTLNFSYEIQNSARKKYSSEQCNSHKGKQKCQNE